MKEKRDLERELERIGKKRDHVMEQLQRLGPRSRKLITLNLEDYSKTLQGYYDLLNITIQNKSEIKNIDELNNEITTLKVEKGLWQKERKQELLDRFLDLQEDLWEIKKCENYGKLFERIMEPIQILVGFSETIDELTDEQKDYYMWDAVTAKLVGAVAYSDGEIREGKFLLPLQQEAFDRAKKKEEMKDVSLEQLEKVIEYDITRKQQEKIALQKRAIVQDLVHVIAQMEEIQKIREEEGFDWKQQINRKLPGWFAGMAIVILERHEVYPLFASDERLAQNPQLHKWFTPLNQYAIRYPGLFIKYGEDWELLGGFTGKDSAEDREVSFETTAETET